MCCLCFLYAIFTDGFDLKLQLLIVDSILELRRRALALLQNSRQYASNKPLLQTSGEEMNH